jgi:dTDP-4-dehydrorhamnose reductase
MRDERSTRWLVTGAGGMFATDLVKVLRAHDENVEAVTRAQLDLTDPVACLQVTEDFDVVVNAAAWTDVDAAESREGEAFLVNAVGASNIARSAARNGATIVHVSTDYVFSGRSTEPYRVDAPLAPINAYGRTKAAGEWAVRADCDESYVVRTAWLYGDAGRSFVGSILRLAGERDHIEVVDDQQGQPTWTRDLADYVHGLVSSGAPFGTYHGTSTGSTTWYGLAQEIFRIRGLDPSRVRPTTAADFVRAASRPAYSVLQNDGQLPSWQDGLGRALASW